jgi:hypothetical protein
MKSFSPTFWQWQHRFVIDAVDQYGLPDVFITLSRPYEWSFLFSSWIERIRQQTGKGPTKLAGHETSHIVNVSTQIVRGYLRRSKSQKSSNHVFNYSGNAKQKYQDLFLSLRVSEKGNHTPSFACVVKGFYQDATLFNKRRFSK